MQVMNGLDGGGSLTPKMALIIYTKDDPAARGFGVGDAVITVNGIVGGEIGAAMCLDESTYADLMRRVGGELHSREILPSNVMYNAGDRMMWFAPARRDTIWFKSGRTDFDSALNGKTVLHPPLLFLARAGRISVWALAKNQRPDGNTKLFLAPYFNMYATGNMCEGNVPLPKTLAIANIPTWESAFFDTSFTHSNYSGTKYVAHPKGHDGFWKEMLTAQMWSDRYGAYLAPAPGQHGPVMTPAEALNQ